MELELASVPLDGPGRSVSWNAQVGLAIPATVTELAPNSTRSVFVSITRQWASGVRPSVKPATHPIRAQTVSSAALMGTTINRAHRMAPVRMDNALVMIGTATEPAISLTTSASPAQAFEGDLVLLVMGSAQVGSRPTPAPVTAPAAMVSTAAVVALAISVMLGRPAATSARRTRSTLVQVTERAQQ
jgi:hypothetical protein